MYYCEMGDEGGDLNRGYTGVESTQVKQARGLGEKVSGSLLCTRRGNWTAMEEQKQSIFSRKGRFMLE